jgi:hypothetical protein
VTGDLEIPLPGAIECDRNTEAYENTYSPKSDVGIERFDKHRFTTKPSKRGTNTNKRPWCSVNSMDAESDVVGRAAKKAGLDLMYGMELRRVAVPHGSGSYYVAY